MCEVALSGYATVAVQLLIEVVSKAVSGELQMLKNTAPKFEKIHRTLINLQTTVDELEKNKIPDPAYLTWSKHLKVVINDIEDFLISIKEDPSVKCSFNLFKNHSIAKQVNILDMRLNNLAIELNDMFTKAILQKGSKFSREDKLLSSSVLEENHILGREIDKAEIIRILLNPDSSDSTRPFEIVSIVGFIGVGKTTLAQLVYNDQVIEKTFATKVWLSMPENFNLKLITKSVLECLGYNTTSTELDALQKLLQSELKEKKMLLVIDGAYSVHRSSWDRLLAPLRVGGRGSKVLVTTQSQRVSMVMGANQSYFLEGLSNEDFWTIFSREAFCDESEVDLDLLKIAKCALMEWEGQKGIPLIGRSFGRILSFSSNPDEWIRVLRGGIFELPIGNNDIFPALQVSCFHMPVHIRNCLAFCSLFPLYHEFKMDKLVHMLKAAGYIHSNEEGRFAEVGKELIDEMFKMSLLQCTSLNDQTSFSLPHIIHMLGAYICSDDCFASMKSQKHISKNARHAVVDDSQVKIDCIRKFKNLRTFVLLTQLDSSEKFSDSFFEDVRLLRLLDLSKAGIAQLPNNIKFLKFLQYIDLSNSPITDLPVEITSLSNLEALLLENCSSLTHLPIKMYNLVKLTYLGLDVYSNLESLPDLARFPKLVILGSFIVYTTRDDLLDMLGAMNQLRGTLGISRLENVSGVEAAKKALLKEKKDVKKLQLRWNKTSEESVAFSVLLGLKPHTNLMELQISGYGGLYFPFWVGDPLFNNLVNITLSRCKRCRSLPMLGQLPNLKILSLDRFSGLFQIDFALTTGFLVLDTLTVSDMPYLTLWNGPNEAHCPNLRVIKISVCPRLNNLPEFSLFVSLKQVHLENCGELQSLPINGLPGTVDSLIIDSCGPLNSRCQVGGADRYKIEHIRQALIL